MGVRIFLFLVGLLLWPYSNLQAQLCTGSLGEPVVNIDFGKGPNPGPPLTNTTYQYLAFDCPVDGQYAIRSSLPPCFSATWHAIAEDHTPGDVDGYCMVVNASLTPGVFFEDTVSGLCEKTTFEFAAWVMNILKPSSCNNNGIRPDIQFSIQTLSGTVLGTYNTGGIAPDANPTWKQYGFFFTTPVGVQTVVIRVTNVAGGGCGNDLVLDDITFRPCGPTVTATLNNNQDIKACLNQPLTQPIQATISNGYQQPTYQWQLSTDSGKQWQFIPGATQTMFTPGTSNTGSYWYRLAVAEQGNLNQATCRIYSNIVKVFVYTPPLATAGNNGPACVGGTLTLTATGGSSYQWLGPNGFTSNLASPTRPALASNMGVYTVFVFSPEGCADTAFTTLALLPVANANAGADIRACENTQVTLQGSGGGTYQWVPTSGLSDPTSANPSFTVRDTSTYILTVTNGFGCADQDTVTIFPLYLPGVNAGRDQELIAGQSTLLTGTITGTFSQFNWTPATYLSNPTQLSTQATPPTDQAYVLEVVAEAGCGRVMDTVFIRVLTDLKIPNAFSPNGDGQYDVWRIAGLNSYPESRLTIYNRYGQPIIEIRGGNIAWDGTLKGKPLPVGTYYYWLDTRSPRGQLKGAITLIR